MRGKDTMKYVVAFNRNRDFYQVPLALYQRGILQKLITDCYYPDSQLLRAVPGFSRLKRRFVTGLPSGMTRSSAMTVALQILQASISGIPAHSVFRIVDRHLSNAALREAVVSGTNLFLYSQYASQAFSSPLAQGMVKGLFVFHPNASANRDILYADFYEHPECKWSIQHEAETANSDIRYGLDDEWKMADFIVCASSFTARSLILAGCDPSKITVIPYGVDCQPVQPNLREAKSDCRFLFVGQGIQRKGLHHLLIAWKRAGLKNAKLTVIASRLDPGIAALAGDDVVLLGKQSAAELNRHFNSSHVFVMPSLVEGFGLVYLEALASGCYCIGTENTGLPDLDCPEDIAASTPAADIGRLEESIVSTYELHSRRGIDPDHIIDFARQLSWGRFRSRIADVAESYLQL